MATHITDMHLSAPTLSLLTNRGTARVIGADGSGRWLTLTADVPAVRHESLGDMHLSAAALSQLADRGAVRVIAPDGSGRWLTLTADVTVDVTVLVHLSLSVRVSASDHDAAADAATRIVTARMSDYGLSDDIAGLEAVATDAAARCPVTDGVAVDDDRYAHRRVGHYGLKCDPNGERVGYGVVVDSLAAARASFDGVTACHDCYPTA